MHTSSLMHTPKFQSPVGNRRLGRRGFLQTVAASAAAAAASTAFFPSLALAAPGPSVNLKTTYGAKGDGVSDDTNAVLNAMRNNLNGTVIVPAGTYLVRNPIYIQGFCGKMQCDPGARFVFNDATKAGWSFQGGTGAIILNLRVGWNTTPTLRLGSSAGIQLDKTTNTWIDGCVVENSNGAGVNCWVCVSPKVTNTSVANTTSNGFMFANCQTPTVLNCSSTNSHDDGFEFTRYNGMPANWGGYARNLTVKQSHSRGISVNGQSFVEIINFDIDGTSASGILCATDYTYNTPAPESVRFTNGTIKNAGTILPLKGNQFGIEVSHAKSVAISAVTTIGSKNRGISVNAPNGSVTLRDILVQSNLNDAGANLKAKDLSIDLLRTENSPSYGIFITGCTTVTARRLETLNAAKTLSLRRAIWLENNAQIDIQNMGVFDNQTPYSTGYVAGALGSTQTGSITGVTASIAGSQEFQLNTTGSPGVTVVK